MNQDELIEIIDNLPSVSNQKLSETIELMLADNKLFDGDENSLLESQKVVFDESLKRLDSPEVSTSLFFAIYGDNNSNDGFSKIYNEITPEQSLEIRKELFLTHTGRNGVINTDYAGMALKNPSITDGVDGSTSMLLAISNNIIEDKDLNMSALERSVFENANIAYKTLDEQEQLKIQAIQSEISERLRLEELQLENSAETLSKRHIEDLMNTGGVLSGQKIEDKVAPKLVDELDEDGNKRKISVELYDWQKMYEDMLNANADKLGIMGFGEKLANRFDKNGFSPRNASIFGDTIHFKDKYGDAQESMMNISPLNGTMRLSRGFSYEDPAKVALTFKLAAIKARASGWTEIHLSHPGPDAAAKMFLENTILAMTDPDIGYRFDQINVPERYKPVLEHLMKMQDARISGEKLDLDSVKLAPSIDDVSQDVENAPIVDQKEPILVPSEFNNNDDYINSITPSFTMTPEFDNPSNPELNNDDFSNQAMDYGLMDDQNSPTPPSDWLNDGVDSYDKIPVDLSSIDELKKDYINGNVSNLIIGRKSLMAKDWISSLDKNKYDVNTAIDKYKGFISELGEPFIEEMKGYSKNYKEINNEIERIQNNVRKGVFNSSENNDVAYNDIAFNEIRFDGKNSADISGNKTAAEKYGSTIEERLKSPRYISQTQLGALSRAVSEFVDESKFDNIDNMKLTDLTIDDFNSNIQERVDKLLEKVGVPTISVSSIFNNDGFLAVPDIDHQKEMNSIKEDYESGNLSYIKLAERMVALESQIDDKEQMNAFKKEIYQSYDVVLDILKENYDEINDFRSKITGDPDVIYDPVHQDIVEARRAAIESGIDDFFNKNEHNGKIASGVSEVNVSDFKEYLQNRVDEALAMKGLQTFDINDGFLAGIDLNVGELNYDQVNKPTNSELPTDVFDYGEVGINDVKNKDKGRKSSLGNKFKP